MNNRVNYTLVGFLVLVGITMILGFAYWMLQPAKNAEIKYYTLYFDESVLGLNIDAPVKYRGISVGKVKKLEINPKNSEQIEVTVSILKTTPIKMTTVAKLTAQGITGLTYINLSLGSELGKDIKLQKGEKYPVIRTAPSFFANFENSLNSVSSSLTTTLGRTKQLLGADNQEQIALLLQKTASVMAKLDKTLDDKTVAHLQKSMKNIDAFTLKLNTMMPEIHKFLLDTKDWELSTANSFDSIKVSYLGLDKSMDGIHKAMSAGESNFAQMSNDILPTLNTTFLDMQDLMVKVNAMLESYRTSPADMLFKFQEQKKGPGEK